MLFLEVPLRAGCLAVVVSLAACDSPPTPVLHTPSTQAVADIDDAHQRYLAAIEQGLRGDALAREIQAVLRSLEAAIAKPPPQPIFLSLYADLLEQDAAQSIVDLERAQDEVLDLCVQWVPAYLAKSRLALREGHVDAAMQHIEDGEDMLREIERFEPQEVVYWFDPRGWFGLPYYDPTLPEAQRQQQVIAQLQGWFEWEDALRSAPGTATDAAQSVGGVLARRLRARLQFEKLRIREFDALSGPSEVRLAAQRRVVDAIEEEVFPLDAEFLDAEVLRASCLLELGEFQTAESVLTGLTDLQRTRLANDPRLLAILLDVYVRWLVATREESIGEPGAPAVAIANVCDDKIAKLGMRLGGLENAGAFALIKIAEAGIVRSEWLDPKNAELHAACGNLLAAARNAIKAEGARDLEPVATALADRLREIERGRRYPNGGPTRSVGAR